ETRAARPHPRVPGERSTEGWYLPAVSPSLPLATAVLRWQPVLPCSPVEAQVSPGRRLGLDETTAANFFPKSVQWNRWTRAAQVEWAADSHNSRGCCCL